MSATEIMVIAIMLGVIGRWAHNEQAIPSAKGLVQIVFALLVLAMLDQGRTEPIAQGLAWIFLAAVCLSDNSPITGLAKVTGVSTTTASGGAAGAAAGAAVTAGL